MKKFYFSYLVFLLLFITAQSYSQLSYGWSEQNSGFTGNLWSVSAVDSNVVWASGDSLKVLRTTNGGINWSVISVEQTGSRTIFPVYNIFAIDANNAICTGSSNTYTSVYKTTNGGVNWSTVFNQIGGFIDNIFMFSNTNGFMSGDPVGGRFSLWKTTDGGNSWDSTGLYLASYSGESGVINNLFVDGNNVWMGIQGSYKIFRSTNYGSNWTMFYTPAIVNCFWSNNPSSGFYILGATQLYSTTNSGGNWSQIPGTPGSAYLCGLTGIGNEWWYIRNGLSIYYSSNNGTSWTTQYTVPSKNFSAISKARMSKYIWCVRNTGGISRYGIVSGIINISKSVPSEYKLFQNYPNPFNPKTKIKFDIKENTYVTLKIFDIMGKEISILINQNLNSGSYSADFDASLLSSGIYFYVLKADNFIDTKRMIIVK